MAIKIARLLFSILDLKSNDGSQWVQFEKVVELLVKSHNDDKTTKEIKLLTKQWHRTTTKYGIDLRRNYLPPDDDEESRQHITEMFDKAYDKFKVDQNNGKRPFITDVSTWVKVCLNSVYFG